MMSRLTLSSWFVTALCLWVASAQPSCAVELIEESPLSGRGPASGPYVRRVRPEPAATAPSAVQQLVNQLAQTEATIQSRADVELRNARLATLTQLRVLLERVTEAGDLDNSTVIRNHIRQLEASTATPAQEIPRLYEHRGQTGKTLLLTVTGSINGSVWGTDIYTDDSDVATAAVHAGLLRVGETGLVQATVLPGQASYTAATRNGVTTYPFPTYGGSFHLSRAEGIKTTGPVTTPLTSVDSLYGQGNVGDVLTLRVTGATTGYVWGTGPYTDDSSLGTAAVHAGVIDVGQTGEIRVRIVAGQLSYSSSAKNGVESRPYADWDRSYVILSGPKQSLKYQVTIRSGAKADPGTLMEYRSHIGQSFLFTVTGRAEDVIYGTDLYSDDSALAAAAVHAGVLKNKETGVVRVTIVAGQPTYVSSTRNGVTSRSWGQWSTSYRVERSVPVSAYPVD